MDQHDPIVAHQRLAGWLGMALFMTGLGMTNLDASETFITGTPPGQILAAGNRRVMILSPAGDILWQFATKLTHDVWMLPNGNILFADGETVTEVTREKKVVFQYRSSEQQGGGTYACQRLPHGLTLVGENSTGRVLEVDTAGKVVFALQTAPCQIGQHQNMRMARKLDNGNYLVCQSGARLVKEYKPTGEVVWEAKVPGSLAFAALRSPAGTTFVSSLYQIVEFDTTGKKVWECSCKEVIGTTIQNLTGIQLLPNGNVVAGCYRAYSGGEGCGLLEISREKKIVWRYSNPKGDDTMMPVQLLTPDGQALPGPCLR